MTDKTAFIKKLFEQSFMVICLIIGVYFIFLEYKDMFHKLNTKSDRDELILLNKVKELSEKNEDLYERLINCND